MRAPVPGRRSLGSICYLREPLALTCGGDPRESFRQVQTQSRVPTKFCAPWPHFSWKIAIWRKTIFVTVSQKKHLQTICLKLGDPPKKLAALHKDFFDVSAQADCIELMGSEVNRHDDGIEASRNYHTMVEFVDMFVEDKEIKKNISSIMQRATKWSLHQRASAKSLLNHTFFSTTD